jgi:hypothetical protein
MKILVSVGLFSLTGFLLFAGFWLALNNKDIWGYFLGAGVFSFLISAAVSSGLAALDAKQEEEQETCEMGD